MVEGFMVDTGSAGGMGSAGDPGGGGVLEHGHITRAPGVTPTMVIHTMRVTRVTPTIAIRTIRVTGVW